MGARAAELTILVDKLFPGKKTPTGFEFFDANTSAKRMLAPDGEGKIQSPWHEFPYTITGQTQLMVRCEVDGRFCVRRAEIIELFSMLGWCTEHWPLDCSPLREFLDANLGSSLVGNAFSGFQVGPALMAGLPAAYTIALQEAVGANEVITLVDSDSDSDESSLAMSTGS